MPSGRRSWAEVLTRGFLEGQIRRGRSVAEIAAEVGCAPNTVRSYLAAAGLTPGRPTSAPGAEELAGAYREAASIDELAASYQVSFSTARRWLLEAGIALRLASRPRLTSRGLDIEAARRRYEAGETLAAIAADLGVSVSALRAHLVASGVQTRRPGRRRGSG